METLFAQGLRALRQTKRLSQSELARRSGIALRTLTYWEAGESLPRVPELQAALNGLTATPEEAAQIMEALGTPRVLRLSEKATATKTAAGFSGAGLGDLLRAMRLRRRVTQAELAVNLGVSRLSAQRWESGQNFISGENLERCCVLLGAAPEERQALRERRLIAPHWAEEDGRKMTGEEVGHRWRERQQRHNLFAPAYCPQTPLFDLEVLAMKRHLQRHAKPDADNRRILANIETDYAVWLHFQGRAREAKPCVIRALHLIREETMPQDFWGELLNLAASGGHLAKRKGDHATSLRVMEEWLPRLPAGFVRAQQLCDMALYATIMGHKYKAMPFMEQAQRSMDCAGNATASATYYHAVTMERIKLISGDAQGISEGLLAECPNNFQRIHIMLLWLETLMGSGERQTASRYLTQAQALLTPETPARLRQSVADYALQI